MTAKVEWRLARREASVERHEAEVGGYALTVWHDAWAGARWRCLRYSASGTGVTVGKAADLPSAQAAAVRAATGLLVEALAAIPVERDWQHLIMLDDSLGMCVEATCLESDNYGKAISLGHALIAAGVAARGGG